MTAFGNMETAVAALRAGAYDFITKPVEMDLLAISLDRAVKHHRLQQQVRRLTETVDRAAQFGEVLGDSPAMQTVYRQLLQIAPTETSVLLTGESGTGKELVARWLHRKSRRAQWAVCGRQLRRLCRRRCWKANCSVTPRVRLPMPAWPVRAYSCEAEGGTLFLDEIGELPASMQVKLLRALEERVVRPVGGSQEVPFDARLDFGDQP